MRAARSDHGSAGRRGGPFSPATLAWVAPALCLAPAACATLRVTPMQVATQSPSRVSLFVQVRTASGEPVRGLTAANFRIFEDDRPVATGDGEVSVAGPEATVAEDAVLLIDLSADVTGTGDDEVIPQAVSAFTVRVGRRAKTAVYAFDGSPELYAVAPFEERRRARRPSAQLLAKVKPKDPSKNLNGAMLAAFDELDAALAASPRPLKHGTLVLFTSGMDSAHRVESSDLRRRLAAVPFDVFAIGVGSTVDRRDLQAIARSGTAMAADRDGIVRAFDDIGRMIEGAASSSYVVSYCSASRAGWHDLRVEAFQRLPDGKEDGRGTFRSRFDATGFGPGCDPAPPASNDAPVPVIGRAAPRAPRGRERHADPPASP
ncbi:MAG: VWA domain-containing protein [Myxococcales bacterium]|nr:VWA domain-containing protein [Myxococcales bacterium]